MARTNRDWKVVSARDVMASRGRLIMRTNRGQWLSQSWPRKRGHPKSQRQLSWVKHFSYLNCLSKMPDPYSLAAANHLASGNGWYPRDMFIAAANGNLFGREGEVKVTTPTCSLTRATNQSLASNVKTAIIMTAADWDNAEFWESVTHPTRMTFKKPGLYWVHAGVNFSSASGSYRFVEFLLNGTTYIAHNTQAPSGSFSFFMQLSKLWYFHTGDYLELSMQQGAGTLQGQVDQFSCVGIVPET